MSVYSAVYVCDCWTDAKAAEHARELREAKAYDRVRRVGSVVYGDRATV